MNVKEKEIRNKLAQCNGSDDVYSNLLFRKLYYSVGVRMMVEDCQAYWLLTDVLANMKLLSRKYEFICVAFYKTTDKGSCKLVFTDGNKNLIKSIPYKYADFPLNNIVTKGGIEPAITMWFQNSTLYLPTEH